MGWLTTAGMSEGVSAALPPSLSIYRLAFFYNFSMRHNHITNSPPPQKKTHTSPPSQDYLLAEDRRDEARDLVEGQAHLLELPHVRRAHALLEVHRQHARPRLRPHDGGDLVVWFWGWRCFEGKGVYILCSWEVSGWIC